MQASQVAESPRKCPGAHTQVGGDSALLEAKGRATGAEVSFLIEELDPLSYALRVHATDLLPRRRPSQAPQRRV